MGRKLGNLGKNSEIPYKISPDFICGAKIPISQIHQLLPGSQLGPQGPPVPGRSRGQALILLLSAS